MVKDAKLNSNAYFANESGAKLASLLMGKVKDWRDWLDSTGKLQSIRDRYNTYYGNDKDGRAWSSKRITRGGKKGEILKMRLNHWASILRTLHTMTTANRPSMEPVATNTDAKSNAQAIIADGLLDYYLKEKNLEKTLKKCVKNALTYDEGWELLTWDARAGEEVPFDKRTPEQQQEDVVRDPTTLEVVEQKPRKEGDIRALNLSIVDVARDVGRSDMRHEWLTFRVPGNRHNFAARYPEQAAKILSLAPETSDREYRLSGYLDSATSSTDLIYSYEFYHAKTDAVPEGKYAVFMADDLLLEEGPLPYPDIPAFGLVVEEEDDAPCGYSPMADLQGPQEALDAQVSLAFTKAQAGVPKIFMPETANLAKKDLGQDFGVFTFRGEKGPMVVELTTSIDKDMAVVQLLQNQMETLSGVNSVVRGNPEQALKGGSGAAYALIQSQSLMSNSGLQAAYHQLISWTGTAIISAHKSFNSAKRALRAIAGESRASMVKEFDGQDFEGIERVTVESGNPLEHTPAGRYQIAELLLKTGAKIDPDRLATVLGTGKIEPTIEELQNEEQFIRQENERLSRGEPIPSAVATENHIKHILSHRPNTIDDKENPQVIAMKLGHIQSHIDQWRQADPAILMALGIPPPPPPPLPMGPPGMSGAPPGGPPPPNGGPPGAGPPSMGPINSPPPISGGLPNGPKMPNLPDGSPAQVPGVTQ